MKKATRVSIEKLIQPYLYFRRDDYILKDEDIEKITDIIVANYTGVFCNVSKNKIGSLIFTVTSIGTKKTVFFESVVR
jgi:hypothetical protein